MSESSNAVSILDKFFTVGVLVKKIFLFQNVVVLLVAKDIGSPSVPALNSYLSTSSHNNIRIGLDAKPAAELEPTIFILPPGNFLLSTVLPLSFDLGSLTLLLKESQSLIMFASLSLDHACAMASVGCNTNVGAGS